MLNKIKNKFNKMKIILITGPSGSGKTTLGKSLINKLKHSHMLSTDDYYKTGIISQLLSKLIKSYFDKEISHDNYLLKKTIKKILKEKKIDHFYKYDFINKKNKIVYNEIPYIEYLIIEGIFTLELLDFIKRYNFLLINLKVNKNICMKRICYRDQLERGKNKKKSIADFNNAWNLYKIKESNCKLIEKDKEIILNKNIDLNDILKKLTK